MENQIVRVGFHGGEIEAVKQGNDVFVSVRRACEHIGIASNGQIEKLKEKEWSVNKFILSTGPDGKMYENFMLHLDSVPMWLATIDTSRVNNESRPVLIAYQKEAAKVLRDHFFGQKLALPSYSEALRQLADTVEAKENLEKEKQTLLLQSKQDEPFTVAGKALLTTEPTCLLGMFAKVIEFDDKIIGQNTLFEYLRNKGILYKKNNINLPYQSQIEAGRFKVKQTPYEKDGKEFFSFTTLITGKGEGFVINLMRKDPDFKNYTIKVRGQNIREF